MLVTYLCSTLFAYMKHMILFNYFCDFNFSDVYSGTDNRHSSENFLRHCKLFWKWRKQESVGQLRHLCYDSPKLHMTELIRRHHRTSYGWVGLNNGLWHLMVFSGDVNNSSKFCPFICHKKCARGGVYKLPTNNYPCKGIYISRSFERTEGSSNAHKACLDESSRLDTILSYLI